jgi:hypothetical protein
MHSLTQTHSQTQTQTQTDTDTDTATATDTPRIPPDTQGTDTLVSHVRVWGGRLLVVWWVRVRLSVWVGEVGDVCEYVSSPRS